MNIRLLSNDDLKNVAILHRLAFPSSALTKLGIETVQRYYKYQLEGPHDACCCGVFIDYQLVGFCFAGVFRGAETGFFN